MEFNGMSKAPEEAFTFIGPGNTPHSSHLYGTLQCNPAGAFDGNSPSMTPDGQRISRLVDEPNCSFNNFAESDKLKYPLTTSVNVQNSVSPENSVVPEGSTFALEGLKSCSVNSLLSSDRRDVLAYPNSVRSPTLSHESSNDLGLLLKGDGESNDKKFSGLTPNSMSPPSCNGSSSRPASNSALTSPSGRFDAVSEINGCLKGSFASPMHEQEKARMDLDKLDETIDYVLSVARSDEPCEGMFVLTCRMKEPPRISSPNVRANTPSSSVVPSPSMSPASSPHPSQMNSSPMLVHTTRSHPVFQTSVSNILSPPPVQRYIVDQGPSILQLAPNQTPCLPGHYNSQTVSFVQLCPESTTAPVIQASQHHLVSPLNQPLTTSSAHVVFHSNVLHGFQNHTGHQNTQFSVSHSAAQAVNMQRIQNSIVSPQKANLIPTLTQVTRISASTDLPVSAYSVVSRTDVSNTLPNRVLPLNPSNICVVRNPIHTSLVRECVNSNQGAENDIKQTALSPYGPDKKSTVQSTVPVSFRHPIIPTQTNLCATSINTSNATSATPSLVTQSPITSSIIPVSDQSQQNVSKKRTNNSTPGNAKRRKISAVVASPLPASILAHKPPVQLDPYSPNKTNQSATQECFERLRGVDVKSLLSAPVIEPFNVILPPTSTSETTAYIVNRIEEQDFLSKKGLKYHRGIMSVSLPRCPYSSRSHKEVDTYLIQHLKSAVPHGPMIRGPKNCLLPASKGTSICASPEPPSFENHMMALFSKMRKFSNRENPDPNIPVSVPNVTSPPASTSYSPLLPMFTSMPQDSLGKSDPERCTPPLALFHMPNPRLLCQPIPLASNATRCKESAVSPFGLSHDSMVKSEDGIVVPDSGQVRPTNGPSHQSAMIDSETGEVVATRASSLLSSPKNSDDATDNDKLHITFTINPSLAVNVPKIVRRIIDLLGIDQQSICFQITRSGAHITLDQKQSKNESVMRNLETQLRQHFTPLSLRFEKEQPEEDRSARRHTSFDSSDMSLAPDSSTLQCHSESLPSPSRVSTDRHMTKPDVGFLFGSSKYPEEPVSILSLANKSCSGKSCRTCSKLVPSSCLHRKWSDELVSLTGVSTRSDSTNDFVFCSNECLRDFAKRLSCHYAPQDNLSVNLDVNHHESKRQLVMCDLPNSVPILLQSLSYKSGKAISSKRQSSQQSGLSNKKRTTHPMLLSKSKKWRGIRWRSFCSDGNSTTCKRSLDEDTLPNLDDPITLQLPHADDQRICSICGSKGDAPENGSGRLLPLDLDQWLHINCALWCYDVYETVGGALNNIDSWLAKALNTKCSKCDRPGAGLPCYNPKCSFVYHVPCAVAVGCMFFTDRGMYCASHAPKDHHPMHLSSLAINRRVYITRDENSQVARALHEDDRTHVIRIGSVYLHSVGQLLPHQIDSGFFHTRRNIYPVGFRSTRLYWSMRRPRSRARYICEILEQNSRPFFRVTTVDKGLEDEVIVHDTCTGVWQVILSRIEALRTGHKLVRLFSDLLRGEDLYGLSEPHIIRAIESIPGVDSLRDYVFNFGRLELISEMPLAINPSGCARSEPKMQTFVRRSRLDPTEGMALTSCRLGSLPGCRRSCYPSLNWPGFGFSGNSMESSVTKQHQNSRSQQYRRLKSEVNANVILGRSRIQGFGLFAARDLEPQTMVIEYIGELIRVELANKREKEYEAHNRGIYMFRLDDDTVIDATVCGGLARYINHSCQPNCYAENVSFGDNSHIVIITNRRIKKGEELCYDYNFDLEDRVDKIPCLCRAPNCRKWMN